MASPLLNVTTPLFVLAEMSLLSTLLRYINMGLTLVVIQASEIASDMSCPEFASMFIWASPDFDVAVDASTTSRLSTDSTPSVFMAIRPARAFAAALSAAPFSVTLPRFVSTSICRPSVLLLHSSFDGSSRFCVGRVATRHFTFDPLSTQSRGRDRQQRYASAPPSAKTTRFRPSDFAL